jgi:hypothetical protein
MKLTPERPFGRINEAHPFLDPPREREIYNNAEIYILIPHKIAALRKQRR